MLQPPFGPSHAHYFITETSAALRHHHTAQAFSYPVNGTAADNHTHEFQGVTSIESGHFHRFVGRSGPPVALPDGSHIHSLHIYVDPEPFLFFEGYYKTVVGIPEHTHLISAYTGRPIGSEPLCW